jgi:amino acid transporter
MKNDSKLSKNLSPINVWSLALGCIIGWGAFVMPGNLFLDAAGPLGTAIGMGIGALIMIIISLSYGYMIKRFPVAGGEFAFTFKSFGRIHAFICAWFLGLSYLSIVPLNATALGLIGRYMFPGLLQHTYLYTIAGWDVYLGEVVFASLALLIFAITSIRGIKVSGKLQSILALTLVFCIFAISIFALFNTNTNFENLKPYFSLKNTPIKGILMIIAIAPWAYVGFDAIPQAAEEFNFSPKKSLGIMISSILIGGLMYVAVNTVTALVFPWNEFIASKPFWATGTAVEQLMGQTGLMLLAFALISAVLTGIIGFYMASSRLIYSLARAHAIPLWFSSIHPSYKTPHNAILFVMFISLIAPWFGRQVLLWIVDMASMGAAIGYFYTCASTFYLLIKEKSSSVLRWFSLLGAILSLGFIFLLVIPGMPTYLGLESRIALIGWIILGTIFYLFSSKKYSKISQLELNDLIINEKDESY